MFCGRRTRKTPPAWQTSSTPNQVKEDGGAGDSVERTLTPKTGFLVGENKREEMIFSFLYLFTFVKWSSKSIHIFFLNAHKLVSAGDLYSFQPCTSTCISKLSSQRSCWHQLISTDLLISFPRPLYFFLCMMIMSLTFQLFRSML